jgi:hypothetical protein
MNVTETVTRKYDSQVQNWSKDPDINVLFLRNSQNFLNDRLKAQGHLFLNEVYDLLGMSRTPQGAISGWLKGPINFWNRELESDEEGAITQEMLIDLVQKRAKEDGEWAIENDLVGDNEDKMRQMMAWVSDPKHIVQCYEYGDNKKETVDWICRDLANASKAIGGSDG